MNTNNQRFTLEEKDNKLIVNAYRKLLRHSRSIVSKSDTNNIKKAFIGMDVVPSNLKKKFFVDCIVIFKNTVKIIILLLFIFFDFFVFVMVFLNFNILAYLIDSVNLRAQNFI